MLSFLMGKRRGRRGERKMGGQPSKIDDSKRDESKGSNADQPTTSTADISYTTAECQPHTLKTTTSTEHFVEIPNNILDEFPVKPGAELKAHDVEESQEPRAAEPASAKKNKQFLENSTKLPPKMGDFPHTSGDLREKPSDAADLSENSFVHHETVPKSNFTGRAYSKGRPDGQLEASADLAHSKMKEAASKCRLDSAGCPIEKEQINTGLTQPRSEKLGPENFAEILNNEISPKVGKIASSRGEKVKIETGSPDNEIVTSMGPICTSVTDQEREHELIISRVSSSDRGSAGVNRFVEPPSAAKSSKDLEKSRKAFFMGLLEETVEEVYPEDVNVSSDGPEVDGNVHSERLHSTSDQNCDFQAGLSSTVGTNNPVKSDMTHLEKSNSTMDKQFDESNEFVATDSPQNPPNSAVHPFTETHPLTSKSSDFTPKHPQIGEISEKLVSDGVYFALAIETSSRPASCEISGVFLPQSSALTGDEKHSVVGHLDDAAGQTPNYSAHDAAQNDEVHLEQNAPNFNYENESDEPIFKRFDSLEPEEQAHFDHFPQTMGELDCEDDESGVFGDPISINEVSTDEKVTDSGLGNDPELDEILKTEFDDISLDEFEGISIDVVVSEVKREDVKPDEGGNDREIIGNSGGNDVEIGEEVEGDSAGEGVLGERPSGNEAEGKRGPLGSSPVQSAAPRDEQDVGMLTLSNLNESFPGKLTRSSALSSSSDESIGTKKKKHVRWADTDDGRSLESYDEYSSGDDEYSSGDEVAKVTEDAVPAAAGEDDDEDEDTSEEDEDEESDAEENKTGTDDTFTNSDISVTVEPLMQDNLVKDVEDQEDSSEEESEEGENGEEEEMNETEQKTDEETLVENLTRLQEELLTKAANLERAQSDLDAAVLEAEKTRKKIERLQDELNTLKRRNSELQRQIDESSISSEERQRLELRITELESELERVRSDRNRSEDRVSRLERDRDQEIQMVQQALERALGEQEAREARYQKEFESERTLSSQRELQMLDDFEWKLRETEKNAKKKAESAEAEATKRIQDMEAKLVRAEADLERIAELKLCEIELKQLKVNSAEQRRNLRQVTRQYEELQVNEKILQEEVNRLRAALDKEKLSITHLQALHKDELAEKERKLRVKLDVQASQITSEWEDRLRRELSKLKNELENTHREEKLVAVDMAKLLKEQEIQNLKQGWEKKSKELKKEVAEHKQKLEEKDVTYRQEIENAQTSSDRDTLDLRRKMDKLDMEYQSKIEKMLEEHEAEINEVRQECERKIAQVEASYQLQAGTTRTTIELVKQQMTNENQARIERLQAIHRQQMEEQWEMLETQRRNEVRGLEDRHRTALEQLRKELDEIRKVQPPNSTQNSPPSSVIGSFFRYFSQAVTPPGGKQNGRQRTPIPETAKQRVIDQLNQEATNPYSCGDLDGIEAFSTGSDAEKILFAKLQLMTRQANEDKLEIERLKQVLEEKGCVKQQPQQQPQPQQQQQQQQQQQRQQQHPPHPTRRNRKRRN